MMRTLCLLLCLLLLGVPLSASAEECFAIDIDALDMTRVKDADYVSEHLSAPAQALRIYKYISESDEQAAPVNLTLTQADDGTIVYDRNYGYIGSEFDSGVIYLPYVDSRTIPYIVTLTVGDWVYALPFFCQQPRMTDNGACLCGVRMRDFNASLTSDWMMGMMLDLDAMRADGSARYAYICASNACIIGEAQLRLLNDELTVSAQFYNSAAVDLQSSAVYCVTDVSTLTSADPGRVNAAAYAFGQAIPVAGASSCLIYAPMTVAYSPNGLNDFVYDLGSSDLQAQLALWQTNLTATTFAVPPEEAATYTDDWYDDGWDETEDGWDESGEDI